MSKLHDFVEKVKAELADLQAEILEIRPLLHKLETSEPDPVEIRAVATTLHAFYSGVERIFLLIAKDIDNQIPQSIHWHRDLLAQMKNSSKQRPRVIDQGLYDILADYLGFRHFFRHGYPTRLEWQTMEPLTKALIETSRQYIEQVTGFIAELKNQTTKGKP